MPRLSQSLTAKAKSFSLNRSVFFLLTVGLTAGWVMAVKAESPQTAPPQLKETLAQIDAAANSHNIENLAQFYSAEFKNSDGLTRATMEQGLQQLWERYPQLSYRTELQSWENEGNAIVAETVTYITGTQPGESGNWQLESKLRSRQRYEDNKIVYSEILAEQTQITSGANPPKVQVNLPEQVRIGQQFAFDVIVEEPLGDNLLLGTAVEEPIQGDRYSQPTDFELELLPAGGIFKLGKAPIRAENRWISAVLISNEGMTTITRRLEVIDPVSGSRSSPK
ncbi:MAG TPA: hypothetical protein DCL61_27885 [Cyanobacteria bacterium UBA12227]|nr:hypothetical protein [Cyanobacteria bacterium UBA12227]HAX87798.1 hypothetical protein [Cyanobacteria bacterium UBA11370]HBY78481.1 hypothetical protein [Cyanobacteria bacterium UBA11148]